MTIAMTPIETRKTTYARCITLGVYEFARALQVRYYLTRSGSILGWHHCKEDALPTMRSQPKPHLVDPKSLQVVGHMRKHAAFSRTRVRPSAVKTRPATPEELANLKRR
jgi:hypothetical protein